jgi:hypothetical protein
MPTGAVLAIKFDVPTTRLDQTTEHTIQGGFASTIATQQGNCFARHDFQIDSAQDLYRTITCAQLLNT